MNPKPTITFVENVESKYKIDGKFVITFWLNLWKNESISFNMTCNKSTTIYKLSTMQIILWKVCQWIVRPRWENLGKTVWPKAAQGFTKLKAWDWVWKFWGKKPAIIMTEEITTSKTGLGKSSNTVLIYSVVTLHKYMSHLHLINNPRISWWSES